MLRVSKRIRKHLLAIVAREYFRNNMNCMILRMRPALKNTNMTLKKKAMGAYRFLWLFIAIGCRRALCVNN